MDATALKQLEDEIGGVVDRWVSTVLKDRFISKPIGQKPRSLWDRFKQGVSNWWWGPNGDKYNPNRWRNRFGDELGVEESFDPSIFTLHEYKEMKTVVDSVDSLLVESDEGFDKLRLMTLIKSAAQDLKSMLFNAIKDKVVAMKPAPSAPAPSATDPSASAPSTTDSSGAIPQRIVRPSKDEPEVASQKKATGSPSPKKSPGKSATAVDKKAKVNSAVASSGVEKGKSLDSSDTTSSSKEASNSRRASEDESSASQNGDNEKLRGYFYTEKDEPIKFASRIKSFLMLDKYRIHEDLKKWWKSELQKADGKDEAEIRADWYVRLVSEDDFLNSISKIAGISKDEVRRDMVAHLKTLDQQAK